MKKRSNVRSSTKFLWACIITLVMSIVCGIATASTEVYRLERDTETEELNLVGQDMVKRRVCIIDPEEYSILTGQVAQVWKSMHSTEDGRTKLHGRRKEQKIDGTEKTTYYEDGYRFTEKMEVRKTHHYDNIVRTNAVRSAIIRRKPSNISERHWKMRQMREAAKTNAVKTVTLVHDAATGKDTVK